LEQTILPMIKRKINSFLFQTVRSEKQLWQLNKY
jgi:hypothetical protein